MSFVWIFTAGRPMCAAAVYSIQVNNPDHATCNVREIWLDGNELNTVSISLVDGKQEHLIVVTMGI